MGNVLTAYLSSKCFDGSLLPSVKCHKSRSLRRTGLSSPSNRMTTTANRSAGICCRSPASESMREKLPVFADVQFYGGHNRLMRTAVLTKFPIAFPKLNSHMKSTISNQRVMRHAAELRCIQLSRGWHCLLTDNWRGVSRPSLRRLCIHVTEVSLSIFVNRNEN